MTLARTEAALWQWSQALPAEVYDVRAVPEDGGRAVLRRLGAADLAGCAAWLRHMNASGHHIYGRPLDARHVLVDDLCVDGLTALERAHRVSAVVETSPWNHQAWVTIAPSPVPARTASAVARLLAARFHGDSGAASAVQVGRMPGFANRKPAHQRGDGSFPWSRLLRAAPTVDPAGSSLIADVAEFDASCSNPPAPRRGGAVVATTPGAEWREAARRIAGRLPPGTILDRSRVDAAIARRLLARGASEARALEVVLAGPRAAAMGASSAFRYATRTVRAAAAALD
jgi:hypothetical protein